MNIRLLNCFIDMGYQSVHWLKLVNHLHLCTVSRHKDKLKFVGEYLMESHACGYDQLQAACSYTINWMLQDIPSVVGGNDVKIVALYTEQHEWKHQ